MGLYINTNTSSINARRRLTNSTNALSRSFERLSSGLRINSAKDDAAGLAITNRMTAQIRGLDQAVRNSNDGISMAQVAEGALQETTNLIQRMRELAVQAASDTNNESDRISLQEEVSQLIAEVDRIASSTNFNGNKILDGSIINNVLQVGANVGETLGVRIDKVDSNELGRQMFRVSQEGVDTSVGIDAANGNSLMINGVTIRDTVDTDDTLSTAGKSTSAIAKAAAINDATEFTGVRAIAGPTEALGRQVTGGSLDETNYFMINDVKFGGFDVEANDSNGTLVDAINSGFEQTGVLANLNQNGELILTAEDGRNINVEVANDNVSQITGLLSNDTGVAAATIDISGATAGSLAAGFGISSTNATSADAQFYSISGNFTANDTIDLTITDSRDSSTTVISGVTIGVSAGTTGTTVDVTALPFSPAMPGQVASALTGVTLNFADLSGANETGATFSVGFTADVSTATNAAGLIEQTYGGQITLQSEEAAEIDFGTGMNDALGKVRGDVPPAAATGLAIFGTTTNESVNDVDITSREGAVQALDILDLALDQLSSQRASLGAIQNRLESTINSLTTNSENLSASRSRILDADFALETASLSRNQIIQQAGVSILAQANQQPQIALALLG
jgi:flagellin